MNLEKIWLTINGANRMIVYEPEKDTLAVLLRRLGLTGTKIGCGTGVCGACSVILNGQVVRSCMRKMKTVEEYSRILTIEGIGTPLQPHPIQQALIACGAVQCGFCSPGFIVSAYALLLQNESPSRQEVRAWFKKHRNICRCTGYKPIVDAVMLAAAVLRGEKPIDALTYKTPENGEYYGTAVPRPSALAKVTGLCDFGDDIALKMPQGTLHLAIVQPKTSHHAKILSIDTGRAEKMPGVVRVMTAKDIRGTNSIGMQPAHPRNEMGAMRQEILCSEKITRFGDVVALVAADTRENARAAAQCVAVEIEPLPEYLTYLDAVVPGAVSVQSGPNQFLKQPLLKGDYEHIQSIIGRSSHSVSASFHSSRQPHMTVEGDVMQAYWDTDGLLTVQCKAQGVNMARNVIANGIGLPPEKIRIINNPVGGSFGWSLAAASYALAAVAVIETGLPVSLSMSYEEFMHFSGKRAPSYANASLGCDESGKITGLQYDMGMELGPYTGFSERLLMKVAVFFGFPYAIPNIAGLGRAAASNHGYCITYRGFGSPQIFTASEQLIDMLAVKAGIDPLTFRAINAGKPGDTAPAGAPFREISAERLIEKMRPLYQTALAKTKKESTPQLKRGVGVAFGGYNCISDINDRAGCKLEMNPDGSISVYNTWGDVGQGGDIGTVMVVLEALKPLGLKPSDVRLLTGDSKTCPDSGSAAASRSHIMNGFASIDAAKKMLEARDKGDGTYRDYTEMAAAGLGTVFEADYVHSNQGQRALNADTGAGDPFPTYMYVLYMAEVAVDTETGEAKVLKVTAVCDVGRIGNIQAVLGQGYGGISQSIGFALSEEYADVKKHNNMAGAGVPDCEMIPDDIDIYFIDHPRENAPFGSSGCAEMFQTSGHVAVLNAIYNACGVRIFELPARKEKIKAGLDILAEGGAVSPPAPYFLGSDFDAAMKEIIEGMK